MTELLVFNPGNVLERALVDGMDGRCSVGELTAAISGSKLYAVSMTQVHSDGSGFEPLLLEESGAPLVAVFSALSRAGLHSLTAPYILQMTGAELFLRLPGGYGAILNPGYQAQLVIPPSAVTDIKAGLKAQ